MVWLLLNFHVIQTNLYWFPRLFISHVCPDIFELLLSFLDRFVLTHFGWKICLDFPAWMEFAINLFLKMWLHFAGKELDFVLSVLNKWPRSGNKSRRLPSFHLLRRTNRRQKSSQILISKSKIKVTTDFSQKFHIRLQDWIYLQLSDFQSFFRWYSYLAICVTVIMMTLMSSLLHTLLGKFQLSKIHLDPC